jgi:uncharacterized protein (TIGR03435 family)
MTQTQRRSISLFALLSVGLVLSSAAQSGPATNAPAIDVISVKPNPHDVGGGISLRPDGLYAENAPLRFLIRVAFNQQFADSQIVNMPSWADDHFDIVAKVSVGMPDLHSLDRARYIALRSQLLQQALIERFQLKTHTELRQGPVYTLVVAKSGTKLHVTPPNPPSEYVTPEGQHVQLGLSATNKSIAGHAVPLADLVKAMRSSAGLDRVVIDRTGLTGNYDFALNWTPDLAPAPQDNGAPATNFPSLFTAIQEQLGLKLEPTKGPVSTLVIDHVEKPSVN